MTGSSSYRYNSLALIHKAIHWWLFEIGEILRLPARFRKPLRIDFTVSQKHDPRLMPGQSSSRLKGLQHIRLRFTDNMPLYRKIKLPAAAANNIGNVISYEFNKYFPMDADASIYSFRVLQPANRADTVEVEIWAVSKRVIEGLLDQISNCYSIQARTLVVTDESGQDLISYDTVKAQKALAPPANRRVQLFLNVVLLLLTASVLLYPLFKIDLQIAELKSQLARLQQIAQPIQQTRDAIRARHSGIHELLEKKQSTAPQTYIWSRVTRSINGKAVLSRLKISGNDVLLEGHTDSVEQFLRALESDDNILDVVVIGPVESSKDNSKETMKISLRVN